MRLRLLLFLAALALARTVAAQSGLSLIDRFGPDGLPFSLDDPLTVGATGSELRLGAMGADLCSEEDSGTFPNGQGRVGAKGIESSAHGKNSKHPLSNEVGTLAKLDDHVANVDPENLDALPREMPFDFQAWMTAINPANGRLSRFRIFPDDVEWLEAEAVTPERGWGNGGWTSDETEMDEVWTGSGGNRPKNLHLDTMGLGYRDVKGPEGYALGIKTSTFENVLTLPEGSANDLLGTQIDMTVQQTYLEGWVMELTNLDNLKSGISGNFVADLTGLQLNIKLPAIKKSFGGCEFDLSEVSVRLGDPVEASKSWENIKPSEYFVEDRAGIVIGKVKATSTGGAIMTDERCQFVVDTAAGATAPNITFPGTNIRVPLVNEAIEAGAEWLIKTFLMLDPRVKRIFDKLDDYADDVVPADFEKIGEVSGIAGYQSSGRNFKTPIDRVALATFERKGNFKPTEWNYWRPVKGPPSGFEASTNDALKKVLNNNQDFIDSGQRLGEGSQASNTWRYNNGGTILTKSMMLYGNSAGMNAQPEGAPQDYDTDDNIMSEWPVGPNASQSRRQLPDILDHFARWWTFIRFDSIDPYKAAESEQTANWISMDLLIDKPPTDPGFSIDWPPPNFHFGRAQVSAFRAGSGGNLMTSGAPTGAPPFHVDPAGGGHFHGLISVDPVGKSFSIAGKSLRGSEIDTDKPLAGDVARSQRGNAFAWSPVLEMPDNLFSLTDMDNDSGLRWLQAFANRHFEENSQLQFLWDFENDSTLDSDHGQHLSDVGSPAFGSAQVGSVFVFQNEAGGNPTGRTGFAFAPMNEEARNVLLGLAP